MKSLSYSVYRHGHAGISNLIMSVELGVVLAQLMDRVLILRGNIAPAANVVTYAGFPSVTERSTVTDLLELPVPWQDARDVELDGFEWRELADRRLFESVFYYPPSINTESGDFRAFAGKRTDFFTYDKSLEDVPVVRFSGGSEHVTLCYYSYFFYFDPTAKRAASDALSRMRPKPEYAAFAAKVAGELGPFNAVHIRRGDFKHTVGVTTLERQPWEVIEALDQHFDRRDRLVILTDEAEDPFFEEIRAAYRNHVFLDQFVLEHYRAELLNLPHYDSTAIAFLAQLVAAESQDFIGTMTSTFTGLIQRYRGNRGKHERFKFLWNELPEVGDSMERGRHAISHCVPLNRGIMVEEWQGPYSWNRFSPRINPGWQREWPESFLGRGDGTGDDQASDHSRPADIADSAAPGPLGRIVESATVPAETGWLSVAFGDRRIFVGSKEVDIEREIRSLFSHMLGQPAGEVVGRLRIEARNGRHKLIDKGLYVEDAPTLASILRALKHEVVRQFIRTQPDLLWLRAGVAALGHSGVVLAGPRGCGKSALVTELCRIGWKYLSDDVAPLDVQDGLVFPFLQTPQMRRPSSSAVRSELPADMAKTTVELLEEQICREPVPVTMFVLPVYDPTVSAELSDYSPTLALMDLMKNRFSFVLHGEPAMGKLCDLLQRIPVSLLKYSDPERAAGLIKSAVSGTNRDATSRMEHDKPCELPAVMDAPVERDGGLSGDTLIPLRRRPGVMESWVGDELMLDLNDGRGVAWLNQSAQMIWELCDGTRSQAQVAEDLRQRYPEAGPGLESDVDSVVKQLVATRMLSR